MKNTFNLTQTELDQRTAPIVSQLIENSFNKAGYIIYRDERCAGDDEFIREYKGGRKELVKMKGEMMEFEVIRGIE